jgi:hypothetical protein
MGHIGIDVHKKESQICILADGGELIEQRIRTEPERFAAALGGRPRAQILIEASTDSEWVARCLEGLGHEVKGFRSASLSGLSVGHTTSAGEVARWAPGAKVVKAFNPGWSCFRSTTVSSRATISPSRWTSLISNGLRRSSANAACLPEAQSPTTGYRARRSTSRISTAMSWNSSRLPQPFE